MNKWYVWNTRIAHDSYSGVNHDCETVMGYITYNPTTLSDNPTVIIYAARGDILTITNIQDMSVEMAAYWQANIETERWYWLAIDTERQSGIPVPDYILNAYRRIAGFFLEYQQPLPDLDLKHRDIEYTFTAAPYFYIYPHYHDTNGWYDKRPFLNDMDITPQEVLKAIGVIEF